LGAVRRHGLRHRTCEVTTAATAAVTTAGDFAPGEGSSSSGGEGDSDGSGGDALRDACVARFLAAEMGAKVAYDVASAAAAGQGLFQVRGDDRGAAPKPSVSGANSKRS
jgi:hypothetical protein